MAGTCEREAGKILVEDGSVEFGGNHSGEEISDSRFTRQFPHDPSGKERAPKERNGLRSRVAHVRYILFIGIGAREVGGGFRVQGQGSGFRV